MSKKEKYKPLLIELIAEYIQNQESDKFKEYLIINSNLPGRRANLELAGAYIEIIEDKFIEKTDKIWDMCLGFIQITSNEAPTNNPKEFIPFCGIWAIGSIGSINPDYFEEALSLLSSLSSDSRW